MKTQINKDLIESMRAKDALRLTVLRSLKTSITNAEKSQGDTPLNDLEILQIVRKEMKKREDSMDSYIAANRMDLHLKEFMEQQILEKYLPKPLTPEELDDIVVSVIAELQATSKRDMGRVIKEVLVKVEGRMDNKTISKRVGELLN